MNKYRVRITRRDGEEFSHSEIDVFSQTYKGVYFLGAAMIYETAKEDLALSVYAKAKRNLDLSKYSVTLELPGKGER